MQTHLRSVYLSLIDVVVNAHSSANAGICTVKPAVEMTSYTAKKLYFLIDF